MIVCQILNKELKEKHADERMSKRFIDINETNQGKDLSSQEGKQYKNVVLSCFEFLNQFLSENSRIPVELQAISFSIKTFSGE